MRIVPVAASLLISALCPRGADAAVLCQKRSGVVVVREACKPRELPLDLAQFGAAGPKGDPGADGSLRIFGDGSAGSHTIEDFEYLDDPHRQYVDFTVPPGATLVVQSGAVIRCTGTFTNNGTLFVGPGAAGGNTYLDTYPNLPLDAARRYAEPGVAPVGAMSGELGDASRPRSGGSGAPALTMMSARSLLRPGPKAGGGGGGSNNPGGGSLTVIAGAAVVNNGLIDASAADDFPNPGGGGGGGGIVVLASPGGIGNNGSIVADGGRGGDSNAYGGVGGGGGGGIVHLLAPSINHGGVVSVAGGAAGAPGAVGSVTGVPRAGGGGGGACGGKGGFGGGVTVSGTPEAAGAGDPGMVFETLADPTALF